LANPAVETTVIPSFEASTLGVGGRFDNRRPCEQSSFFSRAAHERSEGTMRSNEIRNGNFGIASAQPSAMAILRRGSDRPSLFDSWCALAGYASRLLLAVREEFEHPTTATRVGKTRVTGGALCAVALQRSGQHASMCCLAAR
jgi:hypothetical protein